MDSIGKLHAHNNKYHSVIKVSYILIKNKLKKKKKLKKLKNQIF